LGYGEKKTADWNALHESSTRSGAIITIPKQGNAETYGSGLQEGIGTDTKRRPSEKNSEINTEVLKETSTVSTSSKEGRP